MSSEQERSSSMREQPALARVFELACYLLLTAFLTLQMQVLMVDDAFIYLKVATNIATGKGWIYTESVPVNPCTSPLYLLFLVASLKLGASGEIALLINFWIPFSAGGNLLYRALVPRGTHFATAAVALWITHMSLLTSLGLETAWFAFFLVLTADSFYRNRPGVLAIACAALPLLRLEGLGMLPVIGCLGWWRRSSVPFGPLAAGGLALGLGMSFEWLYFGRLVPHSVLIKIGQSSLPAWSEHNYLVTFLTCPLLPVLTWPVVAFGAWMFTRRVLAQRQESSSSAADFSLPIILFGAIQTAAYTLAKAPHGYYWYLVPGLLGAILLLLEGLAALWDFALPRIWPKQAAQRLARPVAGALLFCSALVLNPALGSRERMTPGSDYLALATWVRDQLPIDYRIAITEVGYLGYFTPNPVIDIYGLVHPDIRTAQGDPWWWYTSHPEVIITHRPPWYGEPSSAWPEQRWSEFGASYRLCLRRHWTELYLRKATLPEIRCPEQ